MPGRTEVVANQPPPQTPEIQGITFYKKGAYKRARNWFQTHPDDAGTAGAQLALLAMGDFSDPGEKAATVGMEAIRGLMTGSSPSTEAQIALALWNMNGGVFDPLSITTDSRSPSAKAVYENLILDGRGHDGIDTLRNLAQTTEDSHLYYMLACADLGVGNNPGEARSMLEKAAALKHVDAVALSQVVGADSDRFGRHFRSWFVWPTDSCRDCSFPASFIACGPSSRAPDWFECNCLLFGCKTDLTCAEFTKYSNSGIFGCLQTVKLPLELLSLAAAGATAIVLPVSSAAAFPLSIVSAGFSALTTAITKVEEDGKKNTQTAGTGATLALTPAAGNTLPHL
jgi:hypothetical protein